MEQRIRTLFFVLWNIEFAKIPDRCIRKSSRFGSPIIFWICGFVVCFQISEFVMQYVAQSWILIFGNHKNSLITQALKKT